MSVYIFPSMSDVSGDKVPPAETMDHVTTNTEHYCNVTVVTIITQKAIPLLCSV